MKMGMLQIPKTRTILLLFCCFLQAISLAQCFKVFSQQYGNPFNGTYYPHLKIIGPGAINNGAIQVTPNAAAASFFPLTNRSGRVLLDQPFKIWESDKSNSNNTRVVSFNSSFFINIYNPSNHTTPAEGLTFMIAPDFGIPSNSSGGYLGLTNAATDGNSSNKFVAIEFDTYKQDFDYDDNHVGLDINGVRSVKAVSLTPYGIVLCPVGVKRYNVWVNYDGFTKVIKVYMAEKATLLGPTPPQPNLPILKSDLDLSKYVNQYSYFGFSASTGNFSELNCVLGWNLTVEILPEDKHPWLNIVIGSCVPVLVLTLIAGAWFGYYLRKKRMRCSSASIKGALKSLPGSPKEYDYKKLKKATNNFDAKNKLGQGGFGAVYKGILPSENVEIAVKCFLRENIKAQDDSLAELTIINRLRHRHLVRLLGWCHKNGKLLLVYEYMPKGSLDQHLFARDKPPLDWNLRYKIISGVASALQYLHNDYDERVVHRDLKASNIMLDSNFNARLGDFGLARVLENEKTSYMEAEGVAGTIGYIAPECFHTGKATQQSDVYAFGAVILEVVCGLRPGTSISRFTFLVDWVWYLHRDRRVLEAVDPRLGQEDYVAEEAERLLLLGLACSHPIASERPKAQAIVQMLSGSMPVPYVPPFKPAFVWPGTVTVDIDSSITETTTLTSDISS